MKAIFRKNKKQREDLASNLKAQQKPFLIHNEERKIGEYNTKSEQIEQRKTKLGRKRGSLTERNKAERREETQLPDIEGSLDEDVANRKIQLKTISRTLHVDKEENDSALTRKIFVFT